MNANRARLTASTKDLLAKWRDTKEYWKDAKSLEFEKKYIEDLLIGVDSAVTVIDELDKLVEKIRKDCE